MATAKEIERDLLKKATIGFITGAPIAIVIFAIY